MIWSDLLAAFALYLILEGLLPFISPRNWRETVFMLAKMPENQLRFFGILSMCAGLLLLALVRG
ncbi:MAG: DUF2065 domain-containing protein [Pseudomonadota bacterium]|nr:DUF2065 domain-containing protein [Pseudomonadota bacterium]